MNIRKSQKSQGDKYTFSILIPTWNNLGFLKLCISSLRKNSHFKLQIIIFINEGKDGTLDWVKKQDEIDYLHADENIGICFGLNISRSLVKSDYIIYMNDDMYVLPDWDLALYNEIEKAGTKYFMFSSTVIEPFDRKCSSVLVKDYGDSVETFREESLLKDFHGFRFSNWSGSMWPPNIVHVDVWDLVGGLSVEFSPGMYSDPDFTLKLYFAGIRIFKGLGNSFVYHFGNKTTTRIKKNKGRKTFLLKWGITSRTFTSKYIYLGQPYHYPLKDPSTNLLDDILNKIKRIHFSIIGRQNPVGNQKSSKNWK